MISKADQALLSKKGISAEQVAEQLKNFKTGFPFLKVEGAATIGKGIVNPTDSEIEKFLDIWDSYCTAGNSILKFVPASGAAHLCLRGHLFENWKGNRPGGARVTCGPPHADPRSGQWVE